MAVITKVKDAFIEAGIRFIKVLRYGNDDVQETEQIGPFGIDSSPINDMVAIYLDTTIKGEEVIIGYINKEQISAPGETRMYAVNDDGILKSWIHLKKDGTIEMMGNGNNLVRFLSLENSLKAFKDSINTELVKVQSAITGLGGIYTISPLNIDISASKINEIKTI